jgi:hypothetical protein
MPKKQSLVVADPEGAFKKFEDLTQRLLAVPREELEKKLRQYDQKKKSLNRSHPKRRSLVSSTIDAHDTGRG